MKRFVVFALLLAFFAEHSASQTNRQDSLAVHSPKKAVWMSAVLPGLGQIYNKKYWKVPIIYAGGAYLVYAFSFNQSQYTRFKNAYIALTDGDPNTVDEFNGLVPKDQLLYYKDQYRRNRDLSVIGFFGLYILQLVDASVDAYFFDFDVSDDLSLKIIPYSSFGSQGICLNLQLKPHVINTKKIRITL